MSTPGITLTITPQDISGNLVGSSQSPSSVRITLCGFGPRLPAIPGTANIVRPGPIWYPFDGTGAPLTISLWGNDVIEPGGTFYEIAVLDAARNVVQANMYQFVGSQTIDLSNATPTSPPPGYNPWIGYDVIVGGTDPELDGSVYNTFDITLTENMAPTIINTIKGYIYQFIIRQNSTGGWIFTWPAAFKNPSLVNTEANSVSTSNYVADINGNLYPPVGWQ
jgi:hypothetical protein